MLLNISQRHSSADLFTSRCQVLVPKLTLYFIGVVGTKMNPTVLIHTYCTRRRRTQAGVGGVLVSLRPYKIEIVFGLKIALVFSFLPCLRLD